MIFIRDGAMSNNKAVEDILTRGRIAADDVLKLRRQVFWKGVVTESDAEMMFKLNDRLGQSADPEAARQWLRTPKGALGDATPLAFAATDVGAREVEDLIGRAEHGVFS
jgi:hypothetical protein